MGASACVWGRMQAELKQIMGDIQGMIHEQTEQFEVAEKQTAAGAEATAQAAEKLSSAAEYDTAARRKRSATSVCSCMIHAGPSRATWPTPVVCAMHEWPQHQPRQ